MIYQNIQSAIFLSRPNRFIAHVERNGTIEICHVKNTGRCRELLVPGCTVYIQEASNPNRRTKYDLIAVQKGKLLINMDSQVPNTVVADWIQAQRPFGDFLQMRREVTYGSSRIDLFLEREGPGLFVEVKGVTLEEESVALFPDAPTQRGVKHLEELCGCVRQGYEAAAVFLIQMTGPTLFRANSRTDPAFAEALKHAKAEGVQIIALDCRVEPSSIEARKLIPVTV